MLIKIGTVSIFTSFNFAVLFSSQICETKGAQPLRVLQYMCTCRKDIAGDGRPRRWAAEPRVCHTVQEQCKTAQSYEVCWHL